MKRRRNDEKKDDIFEHDNSTIIATPLEEIMGSRFGSYSKYIIQDRALPDAPDGLKLECNVVFYMLCMKMELLLG